MGLFRGLKLEREFVGQMVAGRYEVLRLIGRGGMGAVYEVRHHTLDRRFALKTIRAELSDDAEALERLRREAGIISSLRHPHIVDIVDWEVSAGGAPCMVMEYLEGEDLFSRLERTGAMDWRMLARIADQALSALSFAHRANVVHRDLKPQNIFLAHGDTDVEQVKLLDFGLSKFRDGRGLEVTTDARVLGTPAYMAPEQADGRVDDMGPATDVWAMGAVLYRMATGAVPFEGPSIPSILFKVCHGEAKPLSQLRPDAPDAFADVVHAAISRGAGRITSADALRRAVRDALEDKTHDTTPFLPLSTATPTGATRDESTLNARSTAPWKKALAAGIVGMLGAAGLVIGVSLSTERERATLPAAAAAEPARITASVVGTDRPADTDTKPMVFAGDTAAPSEVVQVETAFEPSRDETKTPETSKPAPRKAKPEAKKPEAKEPEAKKPRAKKPRAKTKKPAAKKPRTKSTAAQKTTKPKQRKRRNTDETADPFAD